jgi:adhesin transport system membrane fusion protein
MKTQDQTPIDDGVTDVEVKPDLKQRQVQRLMHALQITLNFFERVVQFASPKSAVDTTASSSTNDLHAPLNARWSIRVMVGGILLLVLWASVGKIDQVTRAQAQIIAAERTQLVQSSDGGVLTQLHVKEGDAVKAGQLLATLQKERAAAAVSDSSAKVAALNITLARLHAEVYGKPLVFDKELLNYTDYIRNQTDLYIKRQTAFKDDIHALQEILILGEDELSINRQLEKSGDVSRAEILRLQRSVADIISTFKTRRPK